MTQPLNVLIVCSGNKGSINPFITEQVKALNRIGIQTGYYVITGKGFSGYLKHFFRLNKAIRKQGVDIVHAHYGLSGLLAVFQRSVPVVITFHGSDVHQKKVRVLSKLAARLSAYNILVEKSFAEKLGLQKNYTVLPCGVDLDVFQPVSKPEARARLNYSSEEQLLLFSSSFTNTVKNYPLAQSAVEKVPGAKLIELKSFTREEVNLLMSAADALLLTSFNEGSPQVVKEAMACNLPVIATPVGDVAEILDGIEGNFIVPYNPDIISSTIRIVLDRKMRPNNRQKIKSYDNMRIARIIRRIYCDVIKK
jgi:teichuronic acid biosynthesis glycosyltransferase TuaC